MTKAVFKLSDMDCVACSITIDGDLEDTDGVDEANTSYAKALTSVTFDPEKISVDEILTIIKKAGYSAKLTSHSNF